MSRCCHPTGHCLAEGSCLCCHREAFAPPSRITTSLRVYCPTHSKIEEGTVDGSMKATRWAPQAKEATVILACGLVRRVVTSQGKVGA